MIAFVPPKEKRKKYIRAAQMLFSSVSIGYLLHEWSLPHITVCQFKCRQKKDAAAVWKELAIKDTFPIRFTGVSFIKGLGIHKKFYWAELSVARDKEVMRVHQMAAAAVHMQGFPCLNDQGDLYRPHLTLARIRLPSTIKKWPDILLKGANFRLELVSCLSQPIY